MGISIFNSDTKVWKVQADRENTNKFSISNGDNRGTHISIPFTCKEDFEKNIDLKVLENTGNPWLLYDQRVGVYFDDKDFAPVGIPSRNKFDLNIVAMAFDVPKGYKMTSCYVEGARIYKVSLDVHKHIDMLASLPEKSYGNQRRPRISVTMVNNNDKKVMRYDAIWDGRIKDGKKPAGLQVNKYLRTFEENVEGKGHYDTRDTAAWLVSQNRPIVSTFHPSSPTHLICIGQEYDKDLIEEAFAGKKNWAKMSKYDIRIANTAEDFVKLAKEYGAVTLAYDTDMSLEMGDANNSNVADYAKACFNTVYYLGKNGFVYKAKVDGVERVVPVKKSK